MEFHLYSRYFFIWGFGLGLLLLITSQAEENGDKCTKDEAEKPKFVYTSEGWAANETDDLKCVSRCSETETKNDEMFKYAGIQEDICVCAAADTDGNSCSDEKTSEILWKSDIETKIFPLKEKTAAVNIKEFSYTPKDQPKIGEIEFKIDIDEKTPAKYLLDYGDGSLICNATTHHYTIPGSYDVVLIAQSQSANVESVKYDTIELSQPTSESFLMNCSEKVEYKDTMNCTITVSSGSDMELKVTILDEDNNEIESFESALPDTAIDSIGPEVPQGECDGIEDSNHDKELVIMIDSPVMFDGNITGVEIYGLQEGEIEIQIQTPETGCCEDCEDPFSPLTPFCTKPGMKFSKQESLEAISKFEKGYNYYPLEGDKQKKVSAGDVIAFKTEDGRIGSRKVEPCELADTFSNGKSSNFLHFIRLIIMSPVELDFQYEFNKTGKFKIKTEIAPNVERSSNVSVAVPLTGLTLTTENSFAQTEKDVMFTAAVESGSDVDITWKIEDKEETEHKKGNVSKQEMTYNYTFQKQGTYDVMVTVSNVFDSLNETVTVTIQKGLNKDDWEFTSNQPKTIPNGIVTFTLKYKEADVPMNTQISFDWGDEEQKEDKKFDDSSNPLEIPHTYRNAKNYTITSEIFNDVSSIKLETQALLTEKIDIVEIDATFREEKDGSYRSGYGPNKDKFPKQRYVKLKLNKKGDIDRYYVDWGDGTRHEYKTNDEIGRMFNETGEYTIKVHGSNAVEEKSDEKNYVITIGEFFGELRLTDFNITTDFGDTKYVEIDFASDMMCVNVDYGDGSEQEKYGPEETCKANFTESTYKGEIPSLPFNVSHVYEKRNYYKFTATVFDEYSGEELSFEFLVNRFPFVPRPSVYIRINSTDLRNPIPFVRSKGYKVETQGLLPRINLNYIVKNAWNVSTVDPITGKVDPNEKNPLTSNCPNVKTRKSSLYLQPLCLHYGVYKITSIYYVLTSEMDPKYPFILTGYTYVTSIKGELHASLIDGDILDVVRGYGQSVKLTGKQSSIDPDYPDNKEFDKMKWYCRQLGEDMIEDAETQEIPPPTGEHTHPDKGGCFGYGPGYINVPDGVWELNTKSMYNNNKTYVVSLYIEKDTRNSSSYVLITVRPYIVPILFLECSNPLLCTKIRDGVSINGVNRLSMKVKCLENCEGITEYHWVIRNLEDENDPDGSQIKNSESYIVGNDEQLIAVMLDFFERYSDIDVIAVRAYAKGTIAETLLEDSSRYKELDHIIKKRSTSEQDITYISMKFIINKPPANGSCEILETGEKALVSPFVIECKDWVDPEGVGIDTYKICSLDENNGTNVLVSSTSTKFYVFLKPGRLQLFAHVSDNFGAVTKYRIGEVDVNSVTDDDLEDYIDNKELDYLQANGNQFQYMQGMQAWAASANQIYHTGSSKLENQERVAEISQTITDNLRRLTEINMNTFNDIEMVANTAGSLVNDGRFLDRDGKNAALEILDEVYENLNIPNNSIQFLTPVQATILYQNSFSVLGGVSASISQTVIKTQFAANDVKNADSIEYDTSIDDDPNFQVATSIEDAQKRNVLQDAKKQSKGQSKSIKGIVEDAVSSVLTNLVPGENPIAFETDGGVSTYFISTRGNESEDLNTAVGGADFQLPNFCDLINNNTDETGAECDLTVPLGVAVLTWPTLVDVHTDSVYNLSRNSKILEIQIYSGVLASEAPLEIKNSSSPIEIVIPRTSSDSEDDNSTSDNDAVRFPKMKWFEDLTYHQLSIDNKDVSFNFYFSTNATNNFYLILFRYDKKPTLQKYELYWIVDFSSGNYPDNTFGQFVKSDLIQDRIGHFYIGISQLLDNVTAEQLTNVSNIDKSMINREWNDSYTFKTLTSSCWYYDEAHEVWKNDGCHVVSADALSTRCQCNHLTAFGGGLVVPPNPIDFSYVFANASFTDNLTIYITIILTFSLFLIFLIWARRKDRKDVEKIGALPMPDNNEDDKYIYEILVFTSDIKGASCDSKISFILSGDRDETDIRTFGNPPRKCFRKNGVDVFIMTVPRPLGQLQFLRIWHDSSGKGDFASWYMNYIIFHDVQTGEKFEFIGDTWFALEKGDGQIDRIITVADKEKLTEFSHLFTTTSRKNLTDGHLWFSIFLRPPRSRFTRCQRVCSCVAFLYLSMLVNAMWYGTMPEKPHKGLSLGPFNLTPEQISVGFFSNIIIFPPSFLILFLFRKSRPRKLRPSRINQALKQENKNGYENRRSLLNDNKNPDSSKKESETSKPSLYQRKKRFTLPWWCTIIAWFLCISCILLSVFFLWAYGIQFGNEKTKKWVTSLIISLFSSIFITQPIKVFLVAMFLSAVCKKVETDQDDADEDEEDPHLKFDEQWMHEDDPIKPRRVAYKLTNSEDVERAREERIKESQMFNILREIFAYVTFLWILAVVGFGSRDSNAILMYKTLTMNFLDIQKNHGYLHIKTIDDYWNWANGKLLYNLRATRTYNNEPPYGMKGFLNDYVNRMMGYAIMRQIRFKPGKCEAPRIARDVMNCTGTHTSMLDEDTNDYGPGWQFPPLKDTSSPINKAFLHRSASSLKGYPVLGSMDIYSGGGYVYELKQSTDDIKNDFKVLKENNWIDKYSKALFVEFSVYNAQVNLFGMVNIFVEFGPAGSVIPDYNIEAIQLMPHENISGTFVLICEIVFVFFIIYYTFTELRNMCKFRGEYFRQFSSLGEWALILLSYTAIAFYILRYFSVQQVLKEFHETGGNKYINLQKSQYLNHSFTYLLALIIFIAILKFIKLLRFNKRMSVLSDTLKQCASDLWGFGLVILIVFASFGQMFYLVFSVTSKEYSTWIGTMETLVSVTLNKFDFEHYEEPASRPLGPILFFGFSFLMSIILINLFLTIVIQSFEAVKHDLSKQSNDYEIVDFMFGRIKGLLGMGHRNKRRSPNLIIPKMATEERINPTAEFPEKVDRLLQHINSVYFDGKMDLNSKDVMMYRKKKFNYSNVDHPQVFNSDM